MFGLGRDSQGSSCPVLQAFLVGERCTILFAFLESQKRSSFRLTSTPKLRSRFSISTHTKISLFLQIQDGARSLTQNMPAFQVVL